MIAAAPHSIQDEPKADKLEKIVVGAVRGESPECSESLIFSNDPMAYFLVVWARK